MYCIMVKKSEESGNINEWMVFNDIHETPWSKGPQKNLNHIQILFHVNSSVVNLE